jgi:carboxyl-terminal processing protease
MNNSKIRPIYIMLVTCAAAVILFLTTSFRDGDFQLVKSIDVFCAVFKQVIQNYADDTDPEKLVLKGIDAMLNSLDPYTRYFTEDETKTLKQIHTGKYAGVGATIIQFENRTYIADLLEGCPAQQSGLKHGDIIMAVDTVKIIKQNVNEIGNLLKGDAKTYLNLTIERNGAVKNIRIQRDNITIPNVPYYGIIADSIGYIKLSNFANDAAREVKNALKDLKKKNALKGVVLDLRDNPGGLLNEAVDIVNIFTDKGKIIVSLKKRNTVKIYDYKTQHDATDADIPLAILVNKGSASASEVVSGSIQDLDRGIIVGQKTFGKGLVQSEITMPYNSFLNLTTSKYYIPSGRCIQAIDYFHKSTDGTAPKVADSLRKAFKTLNGRTVYDGGGINPDVTIAEDTLNDFVKTLIIKNLIFQYANYYASVHEKFSGVKTFQITQEILNDFEKFIAGKKFRYVGEVEKNLDAVSCYFTLNNQLDDVKKDIESIKNHLRSDNSSFISENKKIISQMLKSEISSRYFYTKGQIEAYISTDNEALSAIQLLKNSKQYASVLNKQ